MKKYEIWLGYYHLGQGYDPPSAPEKVGTIEAQNFPMACLKYELSSKLKFFEEQERQGKEIKTTDTGWYYNFQKNTNSWTGGYYETEQEAWESIHRRY